MFSITHESSSGTSSGYSSHFVLYVLGAEESPGGYEFSRLNHNQNS